MNNFPSLLKEFFIGFVIFLIPVVSFFKPFNLRQLSTFDFYLILESLIVILFALIIFSFVLHFTITKIFKAQLRSIFPLLCFGFYLLFFFAPFHELVANTIFQQGFASYFTVICLFFIWLAILIAVMYSKKFALVFIRSVVIFASINILLFLVLNTGTGYLNNIRGEKFDSDIQNTNGVFSPEEFDLIKTKNITKNKNIYYIIMDEMLGLKLAEKVNIINYLEVKASLQQANLTYIDKTYSSYNSTHLTLATIMGIDLPITEHSVKYKNESNFFPLMMYQDKKSVPLPSLIKMLGSEFIWVGNKSMSCLEWENQPWTCIYSNKVRNLKHLVRTFYSTTPLERIVFNLLSEGNERNLKYYLEYSRKNKKIDNSKFVFIHQMSPHEPHNVNETCQPKNYTDVYEGYKSSYRCVLQEVKDLMSYIAVEDPEAIVVIQGDHGWFTIPQKLTTPKNKLLFHASIFNAIKAPEVCFEKFGEPQSTVNTIRFILNCAYGFDLPYLPLVHYEAFLKENDPRYGSVIAHKV